MGPYLLKGEFNRHADLFPAASSSADTSETVVAFFNVTYQSKMGKKQLQDKRVEDWAVMF